MNQATYEAIKGVMAGKEIEGFIITAPLRLPSRVDLRLPGRLS